MVDPVLGSAAQGKERNLDKKATRRTQKTTTEREERITIQWGTIRSHSIGAPIGGGQGRNSFPRVQEWEGLPKAYRKFPKRTQFCEKQIQSGKKVKGGKKRKRWGWIETAAGRFQRWRKKNHISEGGNFSVRGFRRGKYKGKK